MLRTQDSTERDMFEEVRKEAVVVVGELFDLLAHKIVEETAKAQERGAKKKK
jgi:hypothetical protein